MARSKNVWYLSIVTALSTIFFSATAFAELVFVEPTKITWSTSASYAVFGAGEFPDPTSAVNAYINGCNAYYGKPTCTLLSIYPGTAATEWIQDTSWWYFSYRWSDGSLYPATPIRPHVYCPEGTTRYYPFKCGYYTAVTPPKKKVALDPGHGLGCPAAGEKIGAVGATDFPVNDPPAGRMREDNLTMAIALQAQSLLSTKYKVILTKKNVESCPTLRERGAIANNENVKVFVAIHINAPLQVMGYQVPLPVPYTDGTSALYNSSKKSSKSLADNMSRTVSQNLGLNNRGAEIRDDLAVLKPTVTNMPAVLIEVGRLSGSDEKVLHAQASAAKAAGGIQAAVQAFVGN